MHFVFFLCALNTCLLVFARCPIIPSKEVVVISSQDEFNDLNTKLRAVNKSIKRIIVNFSPGIYYFNDENEIILDNLFSDIIFSGSDDTYFLSDGDNYCRNDGVLTSSGYYRVKLSRPINADCVFMDNEMRPIYLAESGWLNQKYHTNISYSPITLDEKEGIAKLHIPDELHFLKNKNHSFFKNSRICYKAQWTDCYRNILYSDDQYLYFDLTKHLIDKFEKYVGNMYRWVQKNSGIDGYTPFFITNLSEFVDGRSVYYDDTYLYIPSSIDSIRVCRYKRFMTINNCKGRILLKNMKFYGSATGDQITTYNEIPSTYRRDLVLFSHSVSLEVSNCSFSLMGGGAVQMYRSDHLLMKGNTFTNNFTDMAVDFSGNNQSFTFQDNYIHNPQKIITHLPCLFLGKIENVMVKDNTAIDISRCFSYCGRSKKIKICGNELYNTSDFNSYPIRNLSSDAGAFLYTSSNSPLEVTNNIIHDLAANNRYNGIYIDGGSGNVTIKGNLIYNTAENTIYSRRVTNKDDNGHDNNIEYNIILGKSFFVGQDVSLVNNAYMKGNILPEKVHSGMIKTNVSDKGGHIYVEDWRVEDGIIYVSYNTYKSIKSIPFISSRIKSRIKPYHED